MYSTRILTIFNTTKYISQRPSLQRNVIQSNQTNFARVLTQCVDRRYSTQPFVEQSEDEEELFIKIDVEVKGHDIAVLQSYRKFVFMAAEGLDVEISDRRSPEKFIRRFGLLKSAFVHKKHWVHYESRTNYKTFRLHRVTGSTASTFLEYIQRNLPEGVAMKVTSHQLERLPEEIAYSIQESEGTNVDDVHEAWNESQGVNPETLTTSTGLSGQAPIDNQDGDISNKMSDATHVADDVTNESSDVTSKSDDVTSSDSSDGESSSSDDESSSDEETEQKPGPK